MDGQMAGKAKLIANQDIGSAVADGACAKNAKQGAGRACLSAGKDSVTTGKYSFTAGVDSCIAGKDSSIAGEDDVYVVKDGFRAGKYPAIVVKELSAIHVVIARFIKEERAAGKLVMTIYSHPFTYECQFLNGI